MGRGSNQKFFKRRNINAQKYMRKLSISAAIMQMQIKNNDLSPHSSGNCYFQIHATNAGKDMKKRESSYTVDKNTV